MKRFALLLALAACGEIPVPEGAPTVTVRTNNSLDIHVRARANIEADRLCGEGMRAVSQGEVDRVTTYACVVRR